MLVLGRTATAQDSMRFYFTRWCDVRGEIAACEGALTFSKWSWHFGNSTGRCSSERNPTVRYECSKRRITVIKEKPQMFLKSVSLMMIL